MSEDGKFSFNMPSLTLEEGQNLQTVIQALADKITRLENEALLSTALIGLILGALDRPFVKGMKQVTLTDALLDAIKAAEEGGYKIGLLETLAKSLRLGGEIPPPDGDGTPVPVDNVVSILKNQRAA